MSNRSKLSDSDKVIRTVDPPSAKGVSKTEKVITLPSDSEKSRASNERAMRTHRYKKVDALSRTERTLTEDGHFVNTEQASTPKTKKPKIIDVVKVIADLSAKRSKRPRNSKRKNNHKTRENRKKNEQLQSNKKVVISENDKLKSCRENEIAIRTPPSDNAFADISRTECSLSGKKKIRSENVGSPSPNLKVKHCIRRRKGQKRVRKFSKRRKLLKPSGGSATNEANTAQENVMKLFANYPCQDLSQVAMRTTTPNLVQDLSRTESDLGEFPFGSDDVIVSFNSDERKVVEEMTSNEISTVNTEKSTWEKCLGSFLAVVAFIYLSTFIFQIWRVLKALTAVYETNIDDCVAANILCHRDSIACFSQCGSSRFDIFLSKLLRG